MMSLEQTKPSQKQIAVLADTHVHIYSCFDIERAMDCAIYNLSCIYKQLEQSLQCSDIKSTLFLTERNDCHFFADIATTKLPFTNKGWKITLLEHGKALSLTKDHTVLYIFPGCQIVTQERLEVLALGTAAKFNDGLTLFDTIHAVIDDGSIPVLPWSPGKWTFSRAKKIYEAITTFSPDKLMLADNALRPYGWKEPSLIFKGKKHGFKVLAGSDPLPFAGEEQRIGSYCALFLNISEWNNTEPLASIYQILRETPSQPMGRRLSLPILILKLIKNKWYKKHLPGNKVV